MPISVLPAADHCAVTKALRAQAASVGCTCGAMKPMHRPFCIACTEKLLSSGMTQDLRWVAWSMRQGDDFEWMLYEMLVDALGAMRCGLWTGKSKKRSLENAEEWN